MTMERPTPVQPSWSPKCSQVRTYSNGSRKRARSNPRNSPSGSIKPSQDSPSLTERESFIAISNQPISFIARNESGDDEIKILDFGIAKALIPGPDDSDALTATGSLLGTFTYMAPEQLAGQEADERSDLFSLAVIAVESLTGCRPFQGDSPMEIQRVIEQGELNLGDTGPEARKLQDILRRCLAFDPEKSCF